MPNIYVLYTNYNGKLCLVPIKPTEGDPEKVNKIKIDKKYWGRKSNSIKLLIFEKLQ
jgi:hypothetical protein